MDPNMIRTRLKAKLNDQLKETIENTSVKRIPIKYRDPMRQFLHEKTSRYENEVLKTMTQDEVNLLLTDLDIPEPDEPINHIQQNIMLTSKINHIN